MNNETIETLICLIFLIIFFFGVLGFLVLSNKMENDFELKKLGILKPKNVKYENDYKEKLKYQIKHWIINIIAVFIIFAICKLFGFGISDVIDIIKQ